MKNERKHMRQKVLAGKGKIHSEGSDSTTYKASMTIKR